MKSFEIVYKELEYLLIQKLPESIEKINKEHNDGIILKPFENKSLEENCIKTPSFTFNIEETEYSEGQIRYQRQISLLPRCPLRLRADPCRNRYH